MTLLFRQLCGLYVDWDDEVTGAHKKTCDKWLNLKGLQSAALVEIKRKNFKESRESERKVECSLHGLCNANKIASCSMVYVLCKNGDDVKVSKQN